MSEARQQSSETHQTVGALQPHAAPTPVTAAAPTAPVSTAGALVAQPSDGLSQVPQPSQGELRINWVFIPGMRMLPQSQTSSGKCQNPHLKGTLKMSLV